MTTRPTVTMYSQTFCPYCVMAKRLLAQKGVDPVEINVEEEPARREEMLTKSNGMRTVPQIFIGDHHVGGYTELAALDRAGELESMLAGETASS